MFPRINMKATGQRIRALREKQGLSVRELQAMLGFEQPQAVYRWQRGECLPTVDHLLILSRIFGLPMQDILVIDDQDPAGGRQRQAFVESGSTGRSDTGLPSAIRKHFMPTCARTDAHVIRVEGPAGPPTPPGGSSTDGDIPVTNDRDPLFVHAVRRCAA